MELSFMFESIIVEVVKYIIAFTTIELYEYPLFI